MTKLAKPKHTRRKSAPRKARSRDATGPAPDPGALAQFEDQKRGSVAQLLFKCARMLNERGIARVRAQPGLEALRTSHTNLFAHIDFAGTRLTELARRVGISKQAVAQLVDELETMGVVERVPDPADGRAKLIRYRSIDGVPVLTQGMAVLEALERELADAIGAETVAQLHAALLRLEAHLLDGGGEV